MGDLERLTLAALVKLGSNAYGVPIRKAVSEARGRDVSVGAIYTTLERLEQKGFVSSRVGEATPERGGRAKRYFKIEAAGRRALDESVSAVARMLPDFAAGVA